MMCVYCSSRGGLYQAEETTKTRELTEEELTKVTIHVSLSNHLCLSYVYTGSVLVHPAFMCLCCNNPASLYVQFVC